MKYITIILTFIFLAGCVDTSTPRSVPLNAKDSINILYTGDLPQSSYKYFYVELKSGTECIILRGNNEYNLDCNWVQKDKEESEDEQTNQ